MTPLLARCLARCRADVAELLRQVSAEGHSPLATELAAALLELTSAEKRIAGALEQQSRPQPAQNFDERAEAKALDFQLIESEPPPEEPWDR